MGIVYIKRPSENSVLGLWQITESVDELFWQLDLNSYDVKIYKNKKTDLRKKEWLAGRTLLKAMSEEKIEILYDQDGKPYSAQNNYQLSISHSGQYACVYLDKYRVVGVDIQKLKPTLKGGIDFFLNESEIRWVNCNDNVIMHIIWSVKETIFKYCGIYRLHIKKDVIVFPFISNQKGVVEVSISDRAYNDKVQVAYEVFEDYVLTYTI